MTGHRHDLEARAASYALASLDEHESSDFEAAMAADRRLAEETAGMLELVASLSAWTVPAEPSSTVRSTLLARIAETPQLPAEAAPEPVAHAHAEPRDVVARIRLATDIRTVHTHVAGGGIATLITSPALGLAAVRLERVSAPKTDAVLQLWVIRDAGILPAGFYTPDGGDFLSIDVAYAPGDVVGVSVEPAGGSAQPTTTPIAALQYA